MKLGDLKIMLIDDDTFQLSLIGEILSQLGCENIQLCNSGKQGLINFDAANEKPHIIITDVHMPGIDGFDFLNEIHKRDYRGAVILISGQPATVLHSASLIAQLLCKQHVIAVKKPVERDELEAALKQVLTDAT